MRLVDWFVDMKIAKQLELMLVEVKRMVSLNVPREDWAVPADAVSLRLDRPTGGSLASDELVRELLMVTRCTTGSTLMQAFRLLFRCYNHLEAFDKISTQLYIVGDPKSLTLQYPLVSDSLAVISQATLQLINLSQVRSALHGLLSVAFSSVVKIEQVQIHIKALSSAQPRTAWSGLGGYSLMSTLSAHVDQSPLYNVDSEAAEGITSPLSAFDVEDATLSVSSGPPNTDQFIIAHFRRHCASSFLRIESLGGHKFWVELLGLLKEHLELQSYPVHLAEGADASHSLLTGKKFVEISYLFCGRRYSQTVAWGDEIHVPSSRVIIEALEDETCEISTKCQAMLRSFDAHEHALQFFERVHRELELLNSHAVAIDPTAKNAEPADAAGEIDAIFNPVEGERSIVGIRAALTELEKLVQTFVKAFCWKNDQNQQLIFGMNEAMLYNFPARMLLSIIAGNEIIISKIRSVHIEHYIGRLHYQCSVSAADRSKRAEGLPELFRIIRIAVSSKHSLMNQNLVLQHVLNDAVLNSMVMNTPPALSSKAHKSSAIYSTPGSMTINLKRISVSGNKVPPFLFHTQRCPHRTLVLAPMLK